MEKPSTNFCVMKGDHKGLHLLNFSQFAFNGGYFSAHSFIYPSPKNHSNYSTHVWFSAAVAVPGPSDDNRTSQIDGFRWLRIWQHRNNSWILAQLPNQLRNKINKYFTVFFSQQIFLNLRQEICGEFYFNRSKRGQIPT